MQNLAIANEDQMIRNTLENCIDRISSKSTLRDKDVKSTFMVRPETHRKLTTICSISNLSQQEIYTRALEQYLKGQYLKDINIEHFKTINI